MSKLAYNQHSFPLSRSTVNREKFDPDKHNPLQFLHPNEVTAAVLYVQSFGDPRTASTLPPGKQNTWSVLQSGTFSSRFRDTFGHDISSKQRFGLRQNPAWRAYVAFLQDQTREAVMQMLEQDALDAYQDYKWSRTSAKAAGDYKETRLAAGDHLDRIGATKKPETQAQQVVVVVRGRNFDETSMDKQLPEPEVEVVTVEPAE